MPEPDARTGRPRGSRNRKPSKTAIRNYYALLREAADKGDINAAGKLIELDILDTTRKEDRHA
ncbi:hypothetical protein [Halomonas sp. HG01]|uniref:hypothetical protein n=1 Tax=Halomonas sp. HG01 TaxID=1609967 RepID=UPI0006148CF5|nr:hypothetical protein [Halomonas sp. HG01]